MTIAQRGTATTGTNPNGTSVSALKPSGVKNGDVLIATLVSNNQAATTPSGWTKFEDDSVDTFRCQLYYRVAGGFEPTSYTFSVGTAAPLVLTVSAWSGVDNDTPIGSDAHVQTASMGNADEGTFSTPSINSALTDGRMVWVRAARRSDTAPGAPITFDHRVDYSTVAEAGVFSGGSVSYSVMVVSAAQDFEGAGSHNGIAIVPSPDVAETHNVVATFALTAGKVGLQGPAGPQGEQGEPGPAGEDGEDGADGTGGLVFATGTFGTGVSTGQNVNGFQVFVPNTYDGVVFYLQEDDVDVNTTAEGAARPMLAPYKYDYGTDDTIRHVEWRGLKWETNYRVVTVYKVRSTPYSG